MRRAVILGLAGTSVLPDEAALFGAADPWGFILFRRNIEDSAQLRALTDRLREIVGWDAPIFVDQEGGTVQRLRPPLARDWPDASAQTGGIAAVRLRHRLMADELRRHGVDGNCAPVIDVAGPETHPFLQRRIWAGTPVAVSETARAAAEGMLAGGVLPVIKHLPGHGAANADSHVDLPRCHASLADLDARDFVPVRALADLPLGMSAHVVYEALDPDAPGTHSPVVLRHLRDVLGFDGLLLTDDLNMNALGGTIPERAARAIAAGCDIALHCSGDLAEMAGVVGAVGLLDGQAAKRAERALAARHAPEPIDIAAANAEFERLTRTA
ncbi:glycoside hydrolase family 3 protein [Rhodobacter sp. NTK016B]|uniref:glycoside hydrolase family 3 N-terminal domain-containing protein n=1 Tax=Rhodobacter sp. NTK016B TaxID=2759676 RepID=UPI001A8C3E5A|nr:glycoside hydrolase family 3 N-terminal domain-containing protein [Rhodobacter sp. NTK016B]MBN8292395.1 glycoside hydrolase family 3 protein [Rhodobacter sp. NTK016B]